MLDSAGKRVAEQGQLQFQAERGSDWISLTDAGREFHARSPRVDRRVSGKTSVDVAADRRRRREATSAVRWSISARYGGARTVRKACAIVVRPAGIVRRDWWKSSHVVWSITACRSAVRMSNASDIGGRDQDRQCATVRSVWYKRSPAHYFREFSANLRRNPLIGSFAFFSSNNGR